MDLKELRKQALKSIAAIQTNPFSRKLDRTPVVQVYSRQEVFSFPVKYKYLGYNDGRHVYNLDARQVLQYLDRRELEFDISPKQPLKNPLLKRVKRGLRVFVCYTR